MSHSLTQPDEIDHILMAMLGQDMEIDTPIQNGVQLNGVARDVECDEFAMVPEFSYGAVHKKSAYDLPDP